MDTNENIIIEQETKNRIEYLEKERRELSSKNCDLSTQTYKLKNIIEDVFNAILNCILVIRIIVYIGSVSWSWWWLKNPVLAIGIACALTIAHLSIMLSEYVKDKTREFKEI